MKVASLLLLLSGRRGKDIIDIDIRNIFFGELETRISSATLSKTSTAKYHPSEMVFKHYEDQSLCISYYLKHYLNVTKAYRGCDGPYRLFLTTTKPHKECSRDTLSNWLKKVMAMSGVNIDKFKPHSFRSAASSKAHKTLSLSTILKSVGWKRSSTFRIFYQKEIERNEGSFAEVLLKRADDNS